MSALGWIFFAILLLFLPLPILIVIASSFTEQGYITFPPDSLSLKWYVAFLTDARWMTALATSFGIATAAAVLTTAAAFTAALVAARSRHPLSQVFETMVLAPLLFPHAALGMAMLAVVSAFYIYGTLVGVLLVHCIITLPFAYRPIAVNMRSLKPEMEEAAMSLGAHPATVFLRVTLPLVRPGLVTSLLFSFILSFDEVTVTMFLVGPNVTTLPVEIYSFVQESGTPVVAAISTFLVLLTLLIVVLLERLVGLQVFVERDPR